MSAASSAFLANPKSFMKQNILIIDNNQGVLPSNSQEQNFDLESASPGLNAGGDTIPCYRLRNATAKTTDPIPAYWLTYVQGAIEAKTLNTNRQIFFTAGLTGCGFVAGSGPQPIVKHIDGDKHSDFQIINAPANAGMDIYTPANYASDDRGWGMSTVFGVKVGTVWEFWAQARFFLKGGKYQLRFKEGIMPV